MRNIVFWERGNFSFKHSKTSSPSRVVLEIKLVWTLCKGHHWAFKLTFYNTLNYEKKCWTFWTPASFNELFQRVIFPLPTTDSLYLKTNLTFKSYVWVHEWVHWYFVYSPWSVFVLHYTANRKLKSKTWFYYSLTVTKTISAICTECFASMTFQKGFLFLSFFLFVWNS